MDWMANGGERAVAAETSAMGRVEGQWASGVLGCQGAMKCM